MMVCTKATGADQTLHNSIFLRDQFGNSALHLAVIHDLPDMYDYVLSVAAQKGADSRAAFQNWTNNERLTALSLAAAMGKVRMFQHILASLSIIAWSYGPVTRELVPLRGLVEAQPESGPNGTLASDEIVAMRCICAGVHQPVTQCLGDDDSQVCSSAYKPHDPHTHTT